MRMLAGGDDRIAQHHGVGEDLFRRYTYALTKALSVTEHAKAAGQMTAGGKAHHGDAVRLDVITCRMLAQYAIACAVSSCGLGRQP